MKKTDTRKLKPEVLEALRKQAIRLRKYQKKTYKEIEEITGVHFTTICTWYKSYERDGIQAIKNKNEVVDMVLSGHSQSTRKKKFRNRLLTKTRTR